jgi:antigen flippase
MTASTGSAAAPRSETVDTVAGVGLDATGISAAVSAEASLAAEGAQVPLGRAFLVTMLGSLGVLSLNLLTGLLTARLLGPVGKGEFVSITVWVGMVSLVAQVGLTDAVTFLQARYADDGPAILGTAAALVATLSCVGIAVVVLLVPLAFRAQSTHTQTLARLMMLSVLTVMGLEVSLGLVAGHHHFRVLALCEFGQPFLFASALLILLSQTSITLSRAAGAYAGSYGIVFVATLTYLLARHGIGRPSRQFARRLLSYGLRLQGSTLGALGNARLDILVMPALLVPQAIGQYSIAVSAASMVVLLLLLFGGLYRVVVPVASRQGGAAGMALVERTVRLVLASASASALAMAVFCPWLIRVVYGDKFAGSVTPLRLLLPGVVVWCGSYILVGGLQAADRPTRASQAQLLGLAATVIGLALTLPTLGIKGAAITSTVSCTVVFLSALFFLGRLPFFSIRRVLSARQLSGDLSWVLGQLRRRNDVVSTTAVRRHGGLVAKAGKPRPAATTAGGDLRVLRRVDFRFLLPHIRLGSTLLVDCGEPDLRAGLALCSSKLTDVSSVSEAQPGGYDVVIAAHPGPASAAVLFTLVRPGGWLYLEVPGLVHRGRQRWFRAPRWWAGRLRAAGYEDVGCHWHAPSFRKCSMMAPLDDSAAVRHLLDRHEGSTYGRLMSLAGRIVLRARLEDFGVLDTSVLGRRPSSAGAVEGEST